MNPDTEYALHAALGYAHLNAHRHRNDARLARDWGMIRWSFQALLIGEFGPRYLIGSTLALYIEVCGMFGLEVMAPPGTQLREWTLP